MKLHYQSFLEERRGLGVNLLEFVKEARIDLEGEEGEGTTGVLLPGRITAVLRKNMKFNRNQRHSKTPNNPIKAQQNH
jgi:hypothetical protein